MQSGSSYWSYNASDILFNFYVNVNLVSWHSKKLLQGIYVYSSTGRKHYFMEILHPETAYGDFRNGWLIGGMKYPKDTFVESICIIQKIPNPGEAIPEK